jgi:MOSC domain-containing protein YiiM
MNPNGLVRLLSVNVGIPRDMVWKGRSVHTGIWKNPVTGRCRVGRLNLEGDGQGDLAGHGGEHRAVFVYQIESYRYWREQLNRSDFVYGQFGENFTIEGLAGDAVCIGDRFQIGTALFEVSSPRKFCSAAGKATDRIAQCRDRRDTRCGDAARTRGGTLDASDHLVALST